MIIRTSGGTLGELSENKIQNCLDFPFYNVYGFKKYRTLFQQAAALLFAFVTFHPFVDGNKRTGLVVTQLFLTLNRYEFSYPDNTFDFVVAVARSKIKSNRKISDWLRQSSSRSTVVEQLGRKFIFPGERVYEILNQLGDEPIRIKRV